MNINEIASLGSNVKPVIQNENCSVLMLNDATEEGVMTVYRVMPGVMICFSDMHMEKEHKKTPEEKAAVAKQKKQQRRAKRKKEAKDNLTKEEILQDDQFFFSAGYTEEMGLKPWEDLEENE